MKFIIHRGAKQIGGSCVEISTATTRLILDAGSALEEPSAVKTKRPKFARPADLPNVSGLFSAGQKVDALLLSHAHGDHTGLLPWVNPEIPIYCSKGTSQMLMAGSLFAAQKNEIPREHQTTLIPGKTIKIGDISVTGLSVDHSAYDCMAFLIEADGKRLLYSGDLRLHGRKPGMARALYKFIADQPVDILLMEGTNFRTNSKADGSDNFTEEDLEATLCRAIKRADQLVLAHFSPQHFDRMISFFKATRDAGRIFVVDAYGAFVWDIIRRHEFRALMAKKQIRVYFNQSFQQSPKKHIPKLNDPFLAARIDLTEILAEPERYTMLFRPSMLDLDFDGRLPKQALCLHSLWGGYLVKPEYKKLQAALKLTGGEFSECHTSGHIFAEDIEKFVKAVNPRHVVPIHTTGRSEFQKRFKNMLAVEDGQIIEV